ncbi:hypothetical protein [Streptomyces sp. NPDC048623]|uniref:hypothetical protein n=1 Tax=Streptomyces sp. NPDC048623 TaxID=3155761 RepID=UPI00342952AF
MGLLGRLRLVGLVGLLGRLRLLGHLPRARAVVALARARARALMILALDLPLSGGRSRLRRDPGVRDRRPGVLGLCGIPRLAGVRRPSLVGDVPLTGRPGRARAGVLPG